MITEPECKVCGQREGPFPGVREAERVLGACGWIRVPPVEAWCGGSWATGCVHSWYCVHCAVRWHRERHEVQRRCGHCGRGATEASARGVRLCHPSDPALPDCHRRVTVWGEPVGALLGDGPKPAGVEGISG